VRVLKFLVVLVVLVPLITYLDSLRLDWKMNNAMTSIESDYPVGMSLDAARSTVSERFPRRFHETTARECIDEAKNSRPSFEPKGGPCLGVFWDVGSTWYGFQSGIQFRLFFDESDRLVDSSSRIVNTFL
jgi:hypothetical protein